MTAGRLAELAARGNVTLLPRTTGFGYFAHNFVGLAERLTDHLPTPDPEGPRERLWHVPRAGSGAGDGRAGAPARISRQ